jgi:hypothetical protein
MNKIVCPICKKNLRTCPHSMESVVVYLKTELETVRETLVKAETEKLRERLVFGNRINQILTEKAALEAQVSVGGKDFSPIYDLIRLEFQVRGKRWPDAWEGLGWVVTELGEAFEQLLAEIGGWTRNNPGDHDGYNPEKFSTELGDIIYMALVTGMARKVDPLKSMVYKAREHIYQAKGIKTEYPAKSLQGSDNVE